MGKSNKFSVYANSVPAPLATELEGDDAWAEWNKAMQAQEARYAPTQPASMPMPLPGGGDPRYAPTQPSPLQRLPEAKPAAPKVPKTPSAQDLITEARRNNRVCPQPAKWTELFRILSMQSMGGNAQHAKLPSPPLTGPAWDHTPGMAKRMCFREHLEWAAANHCSQEVMDFMKALRQDEWFYMG